MFVRSSTVFQVLINVSTHFVCPHVLSIMHHFDCLGQSGRYAKDIPQLFINFKDMVEQLIKDFFRANVCTQLNDVCMVFVEDDANGCVFR